MSVIENNTLEGLPDVGTDLGDFLGKLAPGLGKFIIVLAIFIGIAGLIGAIIVVVKNTVSKRKM